MGHLLGAGVAVVLQKPGRRRILLVDDHPVVREGLARLIDQCEDLYVCGEAGEAEQAMGLLERLQPDLAIVDISLGRADGLELIRQMRVRWPALPILVLSMHSEELYAERVLQAGALGYIMKQEATHYVLTAIRQVLAGSVYVSEAMRGRLLERAVHSKPDEVPALVELLSERELKILRLIARGLNTHEIAERLNVTPNAIESHRNRIRKKLQLRNATQVIQYAVQWVEGTSDDGHDSGSYHGPQ